MKAKKFWGMSALMAFAFAMSFSCVSCGDDKEDIGRNDQDPITPVDPGKDNAMTQEEQKEYLEEVALELMNLVPSSDFDGIKEDVRAIANVDFDDYDSDEIEEWADDIFEDVKKQVGSHTEIEDEWTSSWDGMTYIYRTFYTDYKAVILASNFKGHFTAKNGRWKYSDANDLQFIFPDEDGKQCVAKLETSGSMKKVHLFADEDWEDYDHEQVGNKYYSNDYVDRTEYTIGIPEKIVVTLTRSGATVVTSTTTFDLSNIQNEEFDLSKSSVNAKSSISLSNGYKVEATQVAYSGNKNVVANATIKKDNKALITLAISSDISGIPSVNAGSFEDLDDDDIEDANAKNAYVKIDILGKVQLQGKVSDVHKLVDYMDAAEKNNENESTFKSWINKANGLMDINLFYDNKSTKQASVAFEPFCDRDSYWGDEWYVEPVIKFYDGTSYSSFDAFFNDIDFKTVIRRFERLMDSYEDLLDDIYDDEDDYNYYK